ncbi:MAG TPA: NPCBM/NEW2 domain-containing protein [Tepidisphaeraceae bacterium]|nr:NPCBM/NEW2 domain-containing protein [Tepidisphaeraceae bacterium]
MKSNRAQKHERARGWGGMPERLEPRWLMAARIVGNAAVFQTIQAAVDAAAPNAVINVDPGVYSELVNIYKPLTLRGAKAGVDGRSNARADRAAESVVNGNLNATGTRSTSFYLNADGIVVDGFTFEGQTATGTYGAAVHMSPNRAGVQFLNNIVQNNATGMHMSNGSATAPLVIRGNLFRNNNNEGPHSGRALYTDGGISGGTLRNVIIDQNAFVGNKGFDPTFQVQPAVGFEALSQASVQTNIQVTNNIFDNNGKHLLAFNASNLTISGNWFQEAWDTTSAGIRFEGGMHDVTIRQNNIYGSGARAIRIDRKASSGSNYNFSITNNNFFRVGEDGGAEDAALLTGTSDDPTKVVLDGPLVASGNWWGASNGPGGDWGGPLGSGDDVLTRNAGNRAHISGVGSFATAPVVERQGAWWGTPSVTGHAIQFEDHDHGGSGVAYSDTTGGNSTGSLHHYESVDIGTTTDAGGGHYVGSVKAGEWLEYTIRVTAAGTYTFNARVASSGAGGNYHLELNGTNISGTLSVPSTGGSTTWTTTTKTGVNLPAGVHVLRIAFDSNPSGGSTGNFNWFRFTPTSVQQPPAAPTNLAATAPQPTKVTLSWADNSTNETGFIIERKTGAAGAWAQIGTTASNIATYDDLTVAAGTQYFYRVRANSAAGQSADSNEAQVTTPVPGVTYLSDLPWLGTPTNGWGPIEKDMSVGGSGANDGGVITLNGVTYAKGLGTHAAAEILYNLGGQYATFVSDIGIDDRQSTGGTAIFQVFADNVKIYESPVMGATSATQTINVSVAGAQQLRLVVTDAGDGTSFDHADWAGARLLSPSGPVAPAAPSGLAATPASTAQINLTWTDNASDEDGFRIERSLNGTDGWTEIGTAAANATGYNDSASLSGGAKYYYRVRAYKAGLNSPYTAVANATTQSVPTAPAAPSNLVATAASHAQIDLTWADNSSNETGFVIERSLNGTDGWSVIATPAQNATSYSDSTGLSAGTQYYYRVRATNGVGPSADSNVANATTQAAPTAPAAPSNLSATAVSSPQINLTWADNSGNETGFIIERSPDGATGWAQVGTAAQNATSFANTTGLSAGTQYFYRVRATNAVGPSGDSNVASATTLSNALPTGWANGDIGAVGTAGGATFSGGVYTIKGAGSDIWNAADAFNFTYLPLNGDGSITGRVTGITNTNSYAKAGVMIRESLAANSKHAALLMTPTQGIGFVRRTSTGGASSVTTTAGVAAPYWVRLVRAGSTITAFTSSNGTTWTNVGSTTITMGTNVFVGLAVTSKNTAALNTATVSDVAITGAAAPAPAAPTGLAAQAISPTRVDLTWTDASSDETGFKVERSTDGVNFTTVTTTAAGATGYSDTSAVPGTAYTYRVRATGAGGDSAASNTATATTAQVPPAAPTNLAATAASSTQIDLTWADNASNETGFIIERSLDGATGWTQIATPAQNATSYSNSLGLSGGTQYFYRVRATNVAGASADSNVASATTPTGPSLPAPWAAADIGTVGAAGSSSFASGVYTVKGAGSDIWNAADSFQFMYQQITGDGTFTARVTGITNTNAYAKAGVMIRESLAANSKHAALVVTPTQGVGFVRRTSTGGSSSVTTTAGAAAPYWLRLVRSGATITAFISSNGTTWTQAGTSTVSMTSTVYIGLAVCSKVPGTLNTATFDSVGFTAA